MVDMNQLNLVEFLDLLGLVVAIKTPLSRHLSPAGDHVRVAAGAGDAPLDQVRVPNLHPCHRDGLRRRPMAEGTIPQRGVFGLEVAKETGALGHLHMFADDELGVAAGAAQFHPMAHLQQVGAVVEANPPLEGLFAL